MSSGSDDAHAEGAFPETNHEILKEAADSDWGPFLEQYVAPCWRETVIACRGRGLNIPDTEDVFQELMLRIVRRGKMSPSLRETLDVLGEDASFAGNLPARYLKATDLELHRVRFRTYLKATILNLVRELVRGKHRQPVELADGLSELEPAVSDSLSVAIDTPWFDKCVGQAALQLRKESDEASTKAARRLFDTLYQSIVSGLSPAEMADAFGVSRSTMSTLLTQARARFVNLLQQETCTQDLQVLKQLLRDDPTTLTRALEAARSRSN